MPDALAAEPIPCRGRLGLWTLPPEVAAAVAAQIAEIDGAGVA